MFLTGKEMIKPSSACNYPMEATSWLSGKQKKAQGKYCSHDFNQRYR
jgi:hypothetical protein